MELDIVICIVSAFQPRVCAPWRIPPAPGMDPLGSFPFIPVCCGLLRFGMKKPVVGRLFVGEKLMNEDNVC